MAKQISIIRLGGVTIVLEPIELTQRISQDGKSVEIISTQKAHVLKPASPMEADQSKGD